MFSVKSEGCGCYHRRPGRAANVLKRNAFKSAAKAAEQISVMLFDDYFFPSGPGQ